MTMDGTRAGRCQYCGRELPIKDIALPGHRPMLVTLPCECEWAQADLAREREETERGRMRDAFLTKWNRAGVPLEFANVEPDYSAVDTFEAGRSIYITGKNGRGKTHLACQMAKGWLIRHTYESYGVTNCWKSFMFLTSQQMESLLKCSWSRWDITEEDLYQRWLGVDLLILDDLGKGIANERLAENFFRLLDGRWSDHRPMIMTSQFKTTELAQRMCAANDNTLDSMISRLRGWCDGRVLDGPDRRLWMAG